MTQVDLRTAGPGWEVEFRCGGKATIDTLSSSKILPESQVLSFRGMDDSTYYLPNGCQNRNSQRPQLLDIIALSPPPMTTEQRLAEIAKEVRLNCSDLVARQLAGQSNNALISGKSLEWILALAEGRTP